MSTENKADAEDIAVIEEKDGSATVELPDSIESPHKDPQEANASDGADDGEDADHPDDTDAVREARRNRRRAKKEYIKRTNVEKDQTLMLLKRQNQELMERVSIMERKTQGADLARFEKAIEDEQLRLQYALRKMQEATNNSDGESFTKAQEMWYDSRRKVEAMQDYKERAAKSASQDNSPVNPKLTRLANSWMENNSWYDPEANDEDTQIAKIIDRKLGAEGWDPTSQDYWDELDSRLQKRLPHRYNATNDEPSRRRPKSFVTGSSRETVTRGGSNSFVLEPEQVRAMKDAGFWDDPSKRARMIKRYAQEARNNRS